VFFCVFGCFLWGLCVSVLCFVSFYVLWGLIVRCECVVVMVGLPFEMIALSWCVCVVRVCVLAVYALRVCVFV